MKSLFFPMTILIFACGSSTFKSSAVAAAGQNQSSVTDADTPAIQKLIKVDLTEAFMELATGSTKKFEAILAEDVRLKWPMKETLGKAAFVATIVDSFKQDAASFEIALSNYEFQVKNCGLKNALEKPIGPAPQIEIIKDVVGQNKAVDRMLVIAKFKHAWMKESDAPYIYVDRWIVKKENGRLVIGEYEFSANLVDIPAHPKLLSRCP